MLMVNQSRPAIRTLHGWAISTLRDSGAISECEYHGWMQDRADPHARNRAVETSGSAPGLLGKRASLSVASLKEHRGSWHRIRRRRRTSRTATPRSRRRPGVRGHGYAYQSGYSSEPCTHRKDCMSIMSRGRIDAISPRTVRTASSRALYTGQDGRDA
jgi:hypothetical protein